MTQTAIRDADRTHQAQLRDMREETVAAYLRSQGWTAERHDVLVIGDDPVHTWFELSYAQYLTIPRSILQSMGREWQRRFVQCLEELDEAIDWRPSEGRYWVRLKDGQGRFVHDPFMDYQRGRRVIPLRPLPFDAGEGQGE